MIRSRAVAQPGLNFEYIAWIFTRISGVALISLGIFGLAAAFILGARSQVDLPTAMRWMFFPNPNHVVNSNIPDVVPSWSNGFWQIMQILIVVFGATHGMNGIRVVVEDFIGRSGFRPLIRGIIFLLWMFALIVSVYVILAS